MLGRCPPEGVQYASSPEPLRRICRPDHLILSSQLKAKCDFYEADLRTECMIGFNQSLQASLYSYHGILQCGGNDPERSPALLVWR